MVSVFNIINVYNHNLMSYLHPLLQKQPSAASAGSNGSPGDNVSMDSDSRDEGNAKKVNLDIPQLEMLRDILTYKA